MSDSSSNENGAGGLRPNGQGTTGKETDARQFGLRQLYVKDMSFESPNSPGILKEGGLDPEIKLNLRTSQQTLDNGDVEVVLHVTVHALAGQRTVFLVELQQAGVFQISGFPRDETRAIVGVACPNTLFPYAREAVSSIVQRGGFAPFIIQPMDFTALFAQAQAKRAAGAVPAGQA